MIQGKQLEERALELRAAGHNYRKIGELLDVSHEGARVAVKRAMEKLQAVCDEKAEEVRRIELERLDALQVALWQRASEGDLQAIKQAAAIIQQRCDLLGVAVKDEPVKSDGNYAITIPVAGGVSLTLAPGQLPPNATTTTTTVHVQQSDADGEG